MQVSAEIRWFWKDGDGTPVSLWFLDAHRHGCSAGGGNTRRDVYLLDATQAELGLKLRGGKTGVEVKGLVHGAMDRGYAPFSGNVELWTKWTSQALRWDGLPSLEMSKRRWLRKFETGASQVRELALDRTLAI